MDILLYKDGHLTISESPLQGKENNLEDAVMLISNPQDGDTLTYKNGKWVNGGGGGSGSGGMLVVHESVDEVTGKKTLDKTWQEIHDALVSGVSVTVPHSVTDTKALVGTAQLVEYDEEYGYGVYVGGEYNIAYYTPTTNGYPSSGGGAES